MKKTRLIPVCKLLHPPVSSRLVTAVWEYMSYSAERLVRNQVEWLVY